MSNGREQVLARAEKAFGFVPNLIRELATSPAVANAYLDANAALAQASLTPVEQQVVMVAVSTANGCEYCMAAHRTAGAAQGIGQAELDRIDAGELPDSPRYAALVDATRRVIEKRGWLGADDLAELAERGVDRAQLYEVIAIVGVKTISNFINHIAGTPVDDVFQKQASSSAGRREAFKNEEETT